MVAVVVQVDMPMPQDILLHLELILLLSVVVVLVPLLVVEAVVQTVHSICLVDLPIAFSVKVVAVVV
jgi:hypothetical protein